MPMARSLVRPILALCLVFLPAAALADVLILDNGDTLSGDVVSMKEGVLTFKTDYAGTLSVKWNKVSGLKSETPLTFYKDDKSSFKGKAVAAGQGTAEEVAVETDSGLKRIAPSSIKAINAEPHDVKVRGHGAAAWTKAQGNTDKQNLHGDSALTIRKGKNRWKTSGYYNWGKDMGTLNENNWQIQAGYDRFLTEKLYAYVNAMAEGDEFADLDLRTSLSPGLGYEFYDTDRFHLSVETGPAWVMEKYSSERGDENYVAARWAAHLAWWIWTERIQFYHDQFGLAGVDGDGDLIVQTSTGLKLPVVKGFFTAFQYDLDWNNRPAEGKQQTDQRYMVRVGYDFDTGF